jgi:hypothetical protein
MLIKEINYIPKEEQVLFSVYNETRISITAAAAIG